MGEYMAKQMDWYSPTRATTQLFFNITGSGPL